MAQGVVVGIIGGHVWMGRALGLALLEQNIVSADRLAISSRSNSHAYHPFSRMPGVTDNRELVELADVVVLSVRPLDLESVAIDARGKLVISLLAMTPAHTVAQQVGSGRIVRAMPNAAADIQRGFLPWFASDQVTDADKRLVQRLLESCGQACGVAVEHELDYLTALSGAGPAYPALLAQAMLEHARQAGIADDLALEAVMQTLVGGSLLLEKQAIEPADMVERLIAYDGTTAAGLRAMLDAGFYQAVHHGLDAAHQASSGTTRTPPR